MLDKAVGEGELNVFLANITGFPNMDGDLYTPMEYYLASVIDYLNYINGDQDIDVTRVLGKLPSDADRLRL